MALAVLVHFLAVVRPRAGMDVVTGGGEGEVEELNPKLWKNQSVTDH